MVEWLLLAGIVVVLAATCVFFYWFGYRSGVQDERDRIQRHLMKQHKERMALIEDIHRQVHP